MSDLYNDVWLRRWSLSTTGQAECAEDAVDVTLLSLEDRQAIEAKNADIHQAIADVTALEAAYRVQEPGEDVPETIEVEDPPIIDLETGEGVPQSHSEPHPAWVTFNEALNLIGNAPAEIQALRRIRACEPEEGDADLVSARWGYVVEVTIHAVTLSDLYAERDRRLAAGFDYDFGDERGVHRINTTQGDMIGWDEVTKLAQALINAGQATAPITIATGTGVAEVTAAEWQGVLIAAAQFRQPIWGASFVLENTNPIPENFTADEHWP